MVGGQYFYGQTQNFTTAAATSGGNGSSEAYSRSWLARYEIPATSVSLSTSSSTYNNLYCSSTVSETYGSTKACIFNTSRSTQRIVTHTFEYNGKVLPNYTILYDKDKRCALWAAFEMSKTDYPDNNVGRNDANDYDPALPQDWQPNLKGSYSGSYDRGHQVASNYRQTTTVQNQQTFYHSNMTPQFGSLNQGQWGALEGKVTALATQLKDNEKLYVVTGPTFSSSPATTTDSAGDACPIPNGYYKCLLRCTFDSSGNMTAATGCAYYFNSNESNVNYTLKSIDAIESMTGFDFFANVPDSLETAAEKTSSSLF